MRQVRPPNACRCLADQPVGHIGLRKIAAHDDNVPAHGRYLAGDLVGLVDRGIAMDRHIPAIGGEIERQLAPDALGRACDED